MESVNNLAMKALVTRLGGSIEIPPEELFAEYPALVVSYHGSDGKTTRLSLPGQTPKVLEVPETLLTRMLMSEFLFWRNECNCALPTREEQEFMEKFEKAYLSSGNKLYPKTTTKVFLDCNTKDPVRSALASVKNDLVTLANAGSPTLAPWTDFVGNPIHDGDTIEHPTSKERGIVVYLPELAWRVNYKDGIGLALILQVGAKGQGVVVKDHSYE